MKASREPTLRSGEFAPELEAPLEMPIAAARGGGIV